MSAVLRVEGVRYTYGGAAAPSLRDVSLRVAPGEFVVVAGLSACGKSTLLRAASGLVPHFHGGTFAGRVVVGGLDTREHGPGDLSAVAGTLFQDPETQIVLGTVRNELAFPLENRGAPPAAVARGVEEVALALGIEALLDRSTSELSGGELQRVALGAAPRFSSGKASSLRTVPRTICVSGSWKSVPATALISLGPCSRVSRPATSTDPAASPPWKCGTSPHAARRNVDLPDADSPAATTNSPPAIATDTSCRAGSAACGYR